MFSFHKPKIYRSLHGCCICRAKSSSSRFTDSRRYESDFEQCFGIEEHRSGEICNACVLLVKRWKKLPAESSRNWHHVVDARAGPGTKSMYKIKNRNNKELPDDHSIMKKKHKHKHRKRPSASQVHNSSKVPLSPGGMLDDINAGDEGFSDNYNSRTPSPGNSDISDEEENTPQKSELTSCRRKQANPIQLSSMIDLSYWRKTETCCGIIFKGRNGEVIIDPRLLHPCRTCKLFPPRKPMTRSQSQLKSQQQNTESCASSDSGVSTPAGDQDEASSDMTYTSPSTPPPPTLEPVIPPGQLPPQHLAAAFPSEDEMENELDVEDDASSFMPPIMPLFLQSSQSAAMSSQSYADSLSRSGEDSCSSVEMTSEAAAAAVLDLSMGMSRQHFIPMHV